MGIINNNFFKQEEKTMVSKSMVVKAAEGLHMRPAGVIAREAGIAL